MEVQSIASFTNSKNIKRIFNEDNENENSQDIKSKNDGNWRTFSQNKSNKRKHQLRGSWNSILKHETHIKNLSKEEEWHSILKHELPKKNWTKEEDVCLIEAVERYGPRNWSLIAGHVKGRNGVSCRKRWVQQLDPNIKKTPWTDEENQIIIGAHRIWGNQWSRIARLLPGRTDNGIKNHWHVDLKFLCDQNVTTDEESSNTISNCTALQKTHSNSELDESSSNSTGIHSPEQPKDTKSEESGNELKSYEKAVIESINETNLSTLSTTPNQTLSPLSSLLSSLSRPEYSSMELKSCNLSSNDTFSHSSIIQNYASLDNHDSSISCIINKNNIDKSLSGIKKIHAAFSSISKANSPQQSISNSQESISKYQKMQQEILQGSLEETHHGSFGYMKAGLASWPQSLYNGITSKDFEVQSNSLENSIRMESFERHINEFQKRHNTSHHLDTYQTDTSFLDSIKSISSNSPHNTIPAEVTAQDDTVHPQDIFSLSNNYFSSIISQLIKSKNDSISSVHPPNFQGHQLNTPLLNINDHYNRLTQLFHRNFNPDPVSYSELMASETHKGSFPDEISEKNTNQNETGFTFDNMIHVMKSRNSSTNNKCLVNGDNLLDNHSSNSSSSPKKDIKDIIKDCTKDFSEHESSALSQPDQLSVTEFQRRLLDLILRAPDVLWKRKICWKLSEIVKLIDGIKEKEPSERNVSLEKNLEVFDKSKCTNNNRHLEKWKSSLNNLHQMKYNHTHQKIFNSHQDLNKVIENKKRKFVEDSEIISQDNSYAEKKFGSWDSRNHSPDADDPKDSSSIGVPNSYNKFSSLDLILTHNNTCGNSEQKIEESKGTPPLKSSLSYRCSKCPSLTFRGKNDLRRHLYVHSGKKPFTCEVCGRGFIRRDHKIKHLLKHHWMKNTTNKTMDKVNDGHDMNKIKNIDSGDSLDSNMDLISADNHNDNDSNNNNSNDNDSNNNNDNNDFDNINDNENNSNDDNNVTLPDVTDDKNYDDNNDDDNIYGNNKSNDDNDITIPDVASSHLGPKCDKNGVVDIRQNCKFEANNSDIRLDDTSQNSNESRNKIEDGKKNHISISLNIDETINNGSHSNLDVKSNYSIENEVEDNFTIENNFNGAGKSDTTTESKGNKNFKEFLVAKKIIEMGKDNKSKDTNDAFKWTDKNVNKSLKFYDGTESGLRKSTCKNLIKALTTEKDINSKNSVVAFQEKDKNVDKVCNSYDEIESDLKKIVSTNAINKLTPKALCDEDIVSQIKVLKYIQKMPELGALATTENK